MESLAYLVLGILAFEVLLCASALTFSIWFRLRGKFKKTAMTLTAVLAIVAGWLIGMPDGGIGVPPTVVLVASALLLFLPKRK